MKKGAAGEHSSLASMMLVSMDGVGSGNAEGSDDENDDDAGARYRGGGRKGSPGGSQGGSEDSPCTENGGGGWGDEQLAEAQGSVEQPRAFRPLSPHRSPGAATPPDGDGGNGDDGDDDEVLGFAAGYAYALAGFRASREYTFFFFLWFGFVLQSAITIPTTPSPFFSLTCSFYPRKQGGDEDGATDAGGSADAGDIAAAAAEEANTAATYTAEQTTHHDVSRPAGDAFQDSFKDSWEPSFASSSAGPHHPTAPQPPHPLRSPYPARSPPPPPLLPEASATAVRAPGKSEWAQRAAAT